MKRVFLTIVVLGALAGCRKTDTTVIYFTAPKDSVKTCYYVNQYHQCEAKPAQ